MDSSIKTSKLNLKIVILSRDREKYLIESLNSVLESSKLLPKHILYSIEISDNSEHHDIAKIVEKLYPQISIRLRRPNISAINHLKCVVREANAEYLVMFHDDDIMKPRFLPTLYELLDSNPAVAAIGCNAYYMRNNVDTNQSFMRVNKSTILVDTVDKFLNGYFLIGKSGTSPFPGYMYRIKNISDNCLDESKGGIHADLSFLLDVVERGSILLTSEILMSYRLHENNGNNQTTVRVQLGLLGYLKTKISIKKSRALQDFRYTIMLRWLREQNIKILRYSNWSFRQKVVFKYIVIELFGHIIRPECRALHIRVMRDKYLGNFWPRLRGLLFS